MGSKVTLVVEDHELQEPDRLLQVRVAAELVRHKVLYLGQQLVLSLVALVLLLALKELPVEVKRRYPNKVMEGGPTPVRAQGT
jgi:hypothetical protein